jgi:hypothetical protein
MSFARLIEALVDQPDVFAQTVFILNVVISPLRLIAQLPRTGAGTRDLTLRGPNAFWRRYAGSLTPVPRFTGAYSSARVSEQALNRLAEAVFLLCRNK